MVNVPSPAVVAVLTAPVFWSVRVTVAPGRTPPLESTTLPVTLPWAKAGAASRTASNARKIDPRVRIGASFIVLNQFDESWGVYTSGPARESRQPARGTMPGVAPQFIFTMKDLRKVTPQG